MLIIACLCQSKGLEHVPAQILFTLCLGQLTKLGVLAILFLPVNVVTCSLLQCSAVDCTAHFYAAEYVIILWLHKWEHRYCTLV